MLFVDTQMMHREKEGVVMAGHVEVASAEFADRHWEIDTPQRGTDHVQA